VIPTLILWSHALAALLFGAVAVSQRGQPSAVRRVSMPRRAFVAARAAPALWALAIAGIGPDDISARIAESMRTVAWLGFMLALARRDRHPGATVVAVYFVVMVLAAVSAAVAVIETTVVLPAAMEALRATRLLFWIMATLGALVLMQHLHQQSAPAARGAIRLAIAALGLMWGADLLLFAAAYLSGGEVGWLVVARGMIVTAAALMLAVAGHRSEDWPLELSRTAALRTLLAVGVALYAGIVATMTSIAAEFGGDHARVIQTAIVFGATAALLTLVSTPWLGAWAKVKIAKHLFSHRYDYRGEWQRFTDTLGRPGEGAAPLAERVVKAVADLTDSPAGLLLVPDGGGIGAGAVWGWEQSTLPESGDDARLVDYLADSARIVELDAVRRDAAAGDEVAAIPQWILDRPDAWVIVPLIHLDTFTGAILLARPPVDRALDWEDFDLLRVAGRQAASYLAEDRSHAALADAERFDEFNRRFAFILHDLKNMVSQLSLVARNAERHADNPAFRADMVATLKDSADRVQLLLGRLSQRSTPAPEPLRTVDVAALVERVATSRRATHPIVCRATGSPMASAQAGRLETVLGHLLQNAMEASVTTEPVLLCASTTGDRIVIEVADKGHGMSPSFVRDQLFRPFVSSKTGGFGIGAFEARQLIEGMGGEIAVTSREGEGTVFRLFLPVAQVLENAA
jgi:putative PEP-CTERM system histidine kinase